MLALAVGLSIGVLNRPILLPGIIIGVICSLFSIAGITIGKKLSEVNNKAEIAGGILPIIIGIKILFEHLF